MSPSTAFSILDTPVMHRVLITYIFLPPIIFADSVLWYIPYKLVTFCHLIINKKIAGELMLTYITGAIDTVKLNFHVDNRQR